MNAAAVSGAISSSESSKRTRIETRACVDMAGCRELRANHPREQGLKPVIKTFDAADNHDFERIIQENKD